MVILTDGRHAFSKLLGITSDPTPEELRQIRKEEATRAVKALGVPEKNLFFLDFEDGSLKKYEKEIKGKILAIMKRYSPVEVYLPHSKDHNPDHKTTNRIVKQCIKKSGLSPKCFQYSIVQKYARIGPFIDKLINLFKKHIVEVDISNFVFFKKKAIEQYKSQISIISRRQNRPIIDSVRIQKFLSDKERFYVDKIVNA